DLAAAVDHLDLQLGLHATVTPAAPERHSRVHLHRGYLEVSVGSGDERWHPTMFFLRFDEPEALRAQLAASGVAYRWGEYEGVDGTWDDVEIRIGGVPFPTLIRRTAPPGIARDWPPDLDEPHRCGARTLAAVHVEVPSVGEALGAYGWLLGRELQPSREPAHVPLAMGEVVLHEGPGERIVGVVLGVGSLDQTRGSMPLPLEESGDGVAWLDPEEAIGLRLGFAEVDLAG
ncbi:MAG TPA: hypothetical protein VFT27_08085, partial [Actinomycetota bacterium]|nr:hypothetical protein [Actinomycetota bacterium]